MGLDSFPVFLKSLYFSHGRAFTGHGTDGRGYEMSPFGQKADPHKSEVLGIMWPFP